MAKDMDELNESFQHMLNDDDNEARSEHGKEQESSVEPTSAETETAQAQSTSSVLSPSQEQILQRLQGPETQLQAGIKVLPHHQILPFVML